jgi:cholest-4-en-3-one 26-monooxygenase
LRLIGMLVDRHKRVVDEVPGRLVAGDDQRDEEVFADPHTFDIARTPNDHVTFGGGGVHFCLGASLARAEIKATMRQLVERLPDLELAGQPSRLHSDFVNGIKTMPVRFTPVRSAAR